MYIFYVVIFYVILPVPDGTGTTLHFCVACSLTVEAPSKMQKVSSLSEKTWITFGRLQENGCTVRKWRNNRFSRDAPTQI